MATYDAKICPACGTLGLDGGACPACKAEYPATAVGQPPEPLLWTLTGKRPDDAEARRLSSMRFPRRLPSAGETKKALSLIAGGIVGGVLLFIFALFLIGNFQGLLVIVFGYGGLLVSPFLLIGLVCYGVSILLSNPRKKTPQKMFNRLWTDAYFNTFDAPSGMRFAKPSYGVGLTARAVPGDVGVPRDAMADYIDALQRRVLAALDGAGELDLTCKAKDGSDFTAQWSGVSIRTASGQIREEPLSDTLCRLESSMTITKYKTCDVQRGNYNTDTYRIPVSAVRLLVENYYIRSGKYWFPYDLMPQISEQNAEAAV